MDNSGRITHGSGISGGTTLECAGTKNSEVGVHRQPERQSPSNVSSTKKPCTQAQRLSQRKKEIPLISGLPMNTYGFEQIIKSIWKAGFGSGKPGHVKQVKQKLYEEFETSSNPYALVLHAWMHAFDFSKNTHTLSVEVLKSFKEWLIEVGAEERKDKFLNKKLQDVAFEGSIIEWNPIAVKLVRELYCLDDLKQLAVQRIKDIGRKNYLKALTIATNYELHNEFSIHDFAVPAFLKNHIQPVERYLSKASQRFKEEFIHFFDSWIGNVSEKVKSYVCEHQIEGARTDCVHGKFVLTTVKRLSTKFLISSPNHSRVKRTQELHYLIHQRYSNFPPVGGEGAFELIEDGVMDDTSMIQDAFDSFVKFGDFFAAAKLALSKCMSVTELPVPVKRVMKALDPNCNVEVEDCYEEIEEDWDTGATTKKVVSLNSEDIPALEFISPVEKGFRETTNFYTVKLALDQIRFIDTTEQVDVFLSHVNSFVSTHKLNRLSCVTSIDAEWKSHFVERCGIALLQVRLNDDTFLIDAHALKGKSEQLHWTQLLNTFLGNKDLVKIGYGLRNDIQKFTETCEEWNDIAERIGPILDLEDLSQELKVICPGFFPYDSDPNKPKGLSGLVYSCFKSQLDKSEQISHWEKRPLRQSQIEYAAADAYVLLDIYRFMRKRCAEKGINFFGVFRNAIKGPGCFCRPPSAKKRKY